MYELKFIEEVAKTTTDGVSPPAAFDDRIKGMNRQPWRQGFSLFLKCIFLFYSSLALSCHYFLYTQIKTENNDTQKKDLVSNRLFLNNSNINFVLNE